MSAIIAAVAGGGVLGVEGGGAEPDAVPGPRVGDEGRARERHQPRLLPGGAEPRAAVEGGRHATPSAARRSSATRRWPASARREELAGAVVWLAAPQGVVVRDRAEHRRGRRVLVGDDLDDFDVLLAEYTAEPAQFGPVLSTNHGGGRKIDEITFLIVSRPASSHGCTEGSHIKWTWQRPFWPTWELNQLLTNGDNIQSVALSDAKGVQFAAGRDDKQRGRSSALCHSPTRFLEEIKCFGL